MKPEWNNLRTPRISLSITGQVHGGKNSMGITRSGRHYPRGAFSDWRQSALTQILTQRKTMKPITNPISAGITYTPEDRRRRDIPAIMDALWHVLERARVIADDSQIDQLLYWVTEEPSKLLAGVKIELQIRGRK